MSNDTQPIRQRIESLLATCLEPRWQADPGSRVEITAATSLTSDLALDSFQMMEFLMQLEDEFDITIDMNRLSEVHTVADLSNFVARQAGA